MFTSLNFWPMNLWNLIQSGGWIMLPLLICSIVVCVIFAERFLALRNWREKNESFLLGFSNHWLKGNHNEALKSAQNSYTDVARLAIILNQAHAYPLQKVDRARQESNQALRKNLWILGTVGSAAPFIGLFGTVVGIIESFQSMAQSGAGGFSVVAAGISRALVATAGGILVALCAVFLFNYFQVKVAELQFQLKQFTEDLKELCGPTKSELGISSDSPRANK